MDDSDDSAYSRPPTIEDGVRLPLVECAHEARAGKEMTPERVAVALPEEEAAWHKLVATIASPIKLHTLL